MFLKKIKFILISVASITLMSCATESEKAPLIFPNLEVCTKQMLQSSDSFICMKEDGDDRYIQTNIKFASDSITVRPAAQEVLDKLYAYVTLTNQQTLVIKGYSSRTESDLLKNGRDNITDYNVDLSKNRVNAVREYLIKKGLNPGYARVEVMGYQDPIVPNDSSSNRAINQRVEISIKSNILKQLDFLKKQFKHINIDNYKRFFSNIYLLNDDAKEYISQIYDSRERRPVLFSGFTIFINYDFYSDKNALFDITSKPKPLSELNDDLIVYKLGTARYEYTYKNITTLTITNTTREINIGDYVIPETISDVPLPSESFTLDKKITANVMRDIQNTRTMSSSFNNIMLNKGTADGLKYGTEMFIYTPETRVDGFPVPPKYLGYGFIYRMSEHYSIVLIINSLEEISETAMATTRM